MGRKPLKSIRRVEIINQFYTVAKDIGLENASIAKVAEAMGISNGLIMHYFRTKEELLLGLTDYILQQHLHVLTMDKDDKIQTPQDLNILIHNLFSRKWNQYFDDGVFYSCYALIYRNKIFNDSFKQYLLKLHDVLREKLEQAYKHKIIFNTNLSELTEIIFALIDGSYYYLGMFKDENSHRQQQDIYINHCLSLFKYSET